MIRAATGPIEMKTLIVNGTVVNSTGSAAADVLVDGEAIALVAPGLERAGADRVIDARGRWVIPGGVDAHTHFDMALGDIRSKDTFETGTIAAAFGGTTTILDFAEQVRGGSLHEALERWHALADGNCAVDYGCHMIVSDVNERSLAEMDGLVADGVPEFKLFTAYPDRLLSDDASIFRAMRRATANGGLIMMHAENGPVIDAIAADLVASGCTEPRFHAVSRPAGLEAEATARVIRLAEAAAAAVYVVHLSSAAALEEVRRGRERGVAVHAETCPQYLCLSADTLDGRPDDAFEGAKFVCSPPLRTPADLDALWDGLASNDLQLVATDHCPFDFAGQKERGRGDFRKIPNGLPVVEHRLDLLHYGGVVPGRLTPERWVEIVSAAPARMFGLPRKGAVAPGMDADLVVYDPNRRHTISARTHHMSVDYSCFEGREVRGGADVVMSRGTVVVEEGRFVGPRGHGRFVRRGAAVGA